MSQGGYAIVDVDDDEGAPDLEFKTFLPQESAAGSGNAGPSGSSRVERQVIQAPYSVLNLAYYQVYFDVDTTTILRRLGFALIPRGGFVADSCDGQPDLYGPFWTLTTLVLLLYITSTMSQAITAFMAGQDVPTNIPLLSTATALIYAYGIAVPALLWGAGRWFGVGTSSGPAEVLCVYGYAMATFLPVSLLCIGPFSILRWVVVGIGALTSGFFLLTNIYPILAADNTSLARMITIGLGVLHAGVALAMKILFYSYSVAGKNVGPDITQDAVRRAIGLF